MAHSYISILLYFSAVFLLPTAYSTQTSYVFLHDFARLRSVNNNYLPRANCKFARTTRSATSGSLSCNFTTNFDITTKDDVMILVKTFQFYSNEYRPSLIELTLSGCDALKSPTNKFDIPRILKQSNVPKCPIKKGNYYIRDINPDAREFPPHIPQGKWRLDLHFLWKKIELAVLEWMLTVEKK